MNKNLKLKTIKASHKKIVLGMFSTTAGKTVEQMEKDRVAYEESLRSFGIEPIPLESITDEDLFEECME